MRGGASSVDPSAVERVVTFRTRAAASQRSRHGSWCRTGPRRLVEKATLLRRVQALRRVAENAQDAPAPERAVASLHLFYLQRDLPGLAVAADRKAHERHPSGDTAARLAEALLATCENEDPGELQRRHELRRLPESGRVRWCEEVEPSRGRAAPPGGGRHDALRRARPSS